MRQMIFAYNAFTSLVCGETNVVAFNTCATLFDLYNAKTDLDQVVAQYSTSRENLVKAQEQLYQTEAKIQVLQDEQNAAKSGLALCNEYADTTPCAPEQLVKLETRFQFSSEKIAENEEQQKQNQDALEQANNSGVLDSDTGKATIDFSQRLNAASLKYLQEKQKYQQDIQDQTKSTEECKATVEYLENEDNYEWKYDEISGDLIVKSNQESIEFTLPDETPSNVPEEPPTNAQEAEQSIIALTHSGRIGEPGGECGGFNAGKCFDSDNICFGWAYNADWNKRLENICGYGANSKVTISGLEFIHSCTAINILASFEAILVLIMYIQ